MVRINDISRAIVREFYFPFYIVFGGLYLYNMVIISYNVLRLMAKKKIWYKPSINFLT